MEKMKYKISSRATILLGRESVSKVESALIELIKNTYDADATMCYILFDVENDSIFLIDDGSGMTKKIIEDNWMMIGTDNKKKEYIIGVLLPIIRSQQKYHIYSSVLMCFQRTTTIIRVNPSKNNSTESQNLLEIPQIPPAINRISLPSQSTAPEESLTPIFVASEQGLDASA